MTNESVLIIGKTKTKVNVLWLLFMFLGSRFRKSLFFARQEKTTEEEEKETQELQKQWCRWITQFILLVLIENLSVYVVIETPPPLWFRPLPQCPGGGKWRRNRGWRGGGRSKEEEEVRQLLLDLWWKPVLVCDWWTGESAGFTEQPIIRHAQHGEDLTDTHAAKAQLLAWE